jgi:hypothetical protein
VLDKERERSIPGATLPCGQGRRRTVAADANVRMNLAACRFSFTTGVERKWGCGPLSALLAQIQTYHENADSPHGRRRSTCRLAARRGLATDNGPPPGSSASAASCSIAGSKVRNSATSSAPSASYTRYERSRSLANVAWFSAHYTHPKASQAQSHDCCH